MGISTGRAAWTTAALCCVLGACGSGGQPGSAIQANVPSGTAINVAQAQALLGEVAAQKPVAVDADLWQTLGDALVAELRAAESYREVSAVPRAQDRAVELALTEMAGGTLRLSWEYANRGDYNQDGLVNVSDLTPVGVHFGETSESADWERARVADGNGDGVVNVSDITPIAQNWQGLVTGYALESGGGPDGPWQELAQFALTDAQDDGPLSFDYELPDAQRGRYYRVNALSEDASGEPVPATASAARFYGWPPVGVPELTAQGTRRSPYVGPTQPAVKWIRSGLEQDSLKLTHPVVDAAGRIVVQTGRMQLSIVTPDGEVRVIELNDTPPPYYDHITGIAPGPLGDTFITTNFAIYRLSSTNDLVPIAAYRDYMEYSRIVFTDDHLIYTAGHTLYFDTKDATTLWTADHASDVASVTTGTDGAVYVGTSEGEVICYEPDGSVRWQTSLASRVYQLVSRGDGTALVLLGTDVVKLDAAGREVDRFSFAEEKPSPPPHLALGESGELYIQAGASLLAFNSDWTTNWSNTYEPDYSLHSVNFNCSILLDAAGVIFMPIGKQDYDEYDYLLDYGAFAAIDSSGNELWRLNSTWSPDATPLLASDGTLYLLDGKGTLYAIENGAGAPPLTPTGLNASQGAYADHITLEWVPDDFASHYFVYRDGAEEPLVRVAGSLLDDYDVIDNEHHTYAVVAAGPFGQSAPSTSVSGWLEVKPQAISAGGWYQSDGNSQRSRRVPAIVPAELGEPDSLDSDVHIYYAPLVCADGSLLLQSYDLGAFEYGDAVELRGADLARIWNFSPVDGLDSMSAIGPNGTIYLTPSGGDNHRNSLLALNPDRTIRWTHAPVWGRFVAPPTVGPDGTVYIEDSFRVWHALNPDGSARWYLQSFTGSWDSSGTGRPASVAPDGTIYLIGEELTPHDGVLPEGGYYSNAASNRTITLNAVDPDDGSVLWSFVADYQINCSPTIAPDGTTYFTDTAGVLYSINPEGGENWRLPLDALEVHQLAVGTDGLLYVVHSEPDDAFVDLLQAIEPDGSTRFIWDQSERWITNLLVDAAGRAVFLDDFTGDVVCLEPDGEVLWRYDTGSHLVYQIAVNDAGWLYVFNGFGSMVFDGEGSS